jgi:transcriptional regulator with XRE-family HTH domain
LKGIKQQDMAVKLGMRNSTYQNYEYNTEPKFAVLKQIAQALDVPAFKLLEGIIEFSSESEKSDQEVAFSFSISESDLEKLRASLNVLGEVFSPSKSSSKYKRRDVEDPLDKKKTQSLKSGKIARKGSDR